MKRPTGGRFAPPSQVPPLAFLFSFSFWFTLNLNFQNRRADLPREKKSTCRPPTRKNYIQKTQKKLLITVPLRWLFIFRYCAFRFVIQIKRKLKRKRNQKRNGWSDLRGGASRPPRRFPRFRFRFRFRFNFRLIWITKRNDWKQVHGPPPRTKNSVRKKTCKKQSVSQKIDLVMRIQTVQESSKSELSSVTFGRVKVYKKRAMYSKSYLKRMVIKFVI